MYQRNTSPWGPTKCARRNKGSSVQRRQSSCRGPCPRRVKSSQSPAATASSETASLRRSPPKIADDRGGQPGDVFLERRGKDVWIFCPAMRSSGRGSERSPAAPCQEPPILPAFRTARRPKASTAAALYGANRVKLRRPREAPESTRLKPNASSNSRIQTSAPLRMAAAPNSSTPAS